MSDQLVARIAQSASTESEALLRERFNSLSRLVPVLYASIFIDGVLLAWLFWGAIPIWLHAVLTATILSVVVWRSIYWIRRRGKAYELDLAQVRRAIRGTAIVGPILSLVFSTVGFFLMQRGTATQQSMTLMSIWIVASSSSFCVFALPVTAWLILLASTVPMILAVLLNGDSMLVAQTPAYVAVAVLMMYVVRENHKTFTEIVNSRTKMKGMQDELDKNYKHLALAQLVGGVGSAEVDLRTGSVIWSAHLFLLLDLDRATVTPSLEAFLAAIHPDDRDVVRDAVEKNQGGLRVAPMEFRIVRSDGTVGWLAWVSNLLVSDEGAVEGFVMTVHDITKRKRVELDLVERETQLRRSNQHLYRAQKLGEVGSSEYHPSTGETWWSDEQYEILGLRPGLVSPDVELFLARVHPDDVKLVRQRLKARELGKPVEAVEYRIVRPNGEVRWVYGQSEVVRDADDDSVTVIGTMHDITERKQTEAQLAQAQKMEAVGHLTGGIAHDFNNLLAVILGRLQMLDEELAGNPELRSWVRSSMKAVQHGATLTKSLLAFSRRQKLTPVELDLNEVVDDVEDLLRRTLGEAYELRLIKAAELWTVEADFGQLQNALVSLVLNARDAMPDGGTLTIETSNAALDASTAISQDNLRPGDYVMLSVFDTGVGMSREVAERAFEPFFTTKSESNNSGLGLSMVYGFVKQSGGHVTIDSAPGEGTAVRIYLPRKVGAVAAEPAKTSSARSRPKGTETILIVEDNDEVRHLTRHQLRRLGYTILEAAHGAEGLRVLRENPGIHLLLTDVVLPQGMSGYELVEQATALQPSLKVAFMSGSGEEREAARSTIGRRPFRFLQKPVHIDDLATQVRAVLDEKEPVAGVHSDAPQ